MIESLEERTEHSEEKNEITAFNVEVEVKLATSLKRQKRNSGILVQLCPLLPPLGRISG